MVPDIYNGVMIIPAYNLGWIRFCRMHFRDFNEADCHLNLSKRGIYPQVLKLMVSSRDEVAESTILHF